MKATLVLLTLTTILLSGCGDTEKQTIVKRYFEAMQAKDVATLKAIIKTPKNAEMFSPESGFSFTSRNYEILDDVEQGVNIKYSRFCYDDLIVPTIVVTTEQGYKIDVMATMKGEFKAMKNTKTTKKYCYEFEDKPLSGTLNSTPWSFVKSHQREINWGNEITTSISLYSEECDAQYSGQCTKPSLIISNLNLNSTGGNLGPKENVTIHVPPGDNETVSQGSYRVSPIDDENVKVELSFKTDEGDSLNGHITLAHKS